MTVGPSTTVAGAPISTGRFSRGEDDLVGKVAVVTGAATGIGAATTARLLEAGCRVVAVDVEPTALDETALRLAGKGDLLAIVADVSSEQDCLGYVNAALAQFGAINLFVNNAGILGPKTSIVDTSMDAFDRIHAVNVRGAFMGLKAVLAQMISQNTGGSIVNTASISGINPNRSSPAAYASSKAAVISMTKTAAMENGVHGIRVNAIAPGAVDTAMVSEASRKPGTTVFAKQPVSRIAQPEEIADLITYLLGRRSAFQTGGVYTVDGGALLG